METWEHDLWPWRKRKLNAGGCCDIHILHREQWVERPIDDVFAFFAEARDLSAITPPWIGFKILSMSTPTIEQGTLIRYRIRLHGIPMYWQTEISAWNPPHNFVDDQKKGPYKRWRQVHAYV